MIRTEELCKDFGDTVALQTVNLHVPTGSVFGLVGANGAGKSTLLRHIQGVYRPTAGAVRVANAPVYNNPAVKEKIFSIGDSPDYFMSASTREMMQFFRRLYPRFSRERYEALAGDFPQVEERRPLRRLSRGMQKQAFFRLALACRPELLLLDEPVDGLDPAMRRRVWSLLLEEVADAGMTVLVASHNLRELEDVCDHVGMLDRGRLLFQRRLSELQESLIKIQLAFPTPEHPPLPAGLEVLHESSLGRVTTLIVRGERAAAEAQLAPLAPLFLEALPLSLEEIFIYELGGAAHEMAQ